MAEENQTIKIHVMHCGKMLVTPRMPDNGKITLRSTVGGLFTPESKRIELPVSCYLIEHPKGKVLIDTGFCREISPDGVYDEKAAKSVMPGYLVKYYHPWVEKGCTVVEKLAEKGLKPEDLDIVVFSHLDVDHMSGIRSVQNAKRLMVAEEESYWTSRFVFRAREPWYMWLDVDIERYWYRGTGDGPAWWSYDLFGDGTVKFVNLPGHTTGQAGVKIENNGKFVILSSDAAYNENSWRDMIVPGYGFDSIGMRRSLKWVREQSLMPNCVASIANHDPEVKEQIIVL